MTPPSLLLSACLTAGFIIALINWPGITLAAFLVVACIAALVGGIWLGQCYAEAKEYREEHDL